MRKTFQTHNLRHLERFSHINISATRRPRKEKVIFLESLRPEEPDLILGFGQNDHLEKKNFSGVQKECFTSSKTFHLVFFQVWHIPSYLMLFRFCKLDN